jgi:hypothetical protein
MVLAGSTAETLRVRPISGSEEDQTLIYLPLEPQAVREARFPVPDVKQLGGHDAALLLRDALLLSMRRGAGPFRSFGQIAVEPRAYQLVPLLMALKLDPVRLLIADDVGVGKTIEAALILREMLDRGDIERSVVLCPPLCWLLCPSGHAVLAGRPCHRTLRSPSVVVVQPAQNRNGADHSGAADVRHRRHEGDPLFQALMWTHGVEVSDVFAQRGLEVTSSEDDDLVETLAPYRAEEPLARGVDQRRPDGALDDAAADATCDAIELGAELAVSITDDELGTLAERSGVPELLCHPSPSGGARDAQVNDALAVHVHDEEREDRHEPDIMELQEVAGPDRVVLEEGAPGLAIAGRAWRSQEALNRALGDLDAELQELPANALGTPEPILSRHALDQLNRGLGDACWRGSPTFRLPLPQEPESLAMPAEDGGRAHDERGIPPGPTEGTDQHHQGALLGRQRRAACGSPGNDELLSEKSILGQQLGASTKRVASEPSRGGGGPERFPDDFAQAAGGGLEHGDQRGKHGTISRVGLTNDKTGSSATDWVVLQRVGLVLSVS